MTFKGNYGESVKGNFRIIDSIGIPHPYCIGPRHVAYASDHCMGMLGADAIRGAERNGAGCCVRGCNLPYDEHEQALLVECDTWITDEHRKANPELHEYLLKIKDMAEMNGYSGFAFKDNRQGKDNG